VTNLPVPIVPLDGVGRLLTCNDASSLRPSSIGHRKPPTLLDPGRPVGLAWQSGRPQGSFVVRADRFFWVEERPALLLRPAGYNPTTMPAFCQQYYYHFQYELQDRHRPT